jgi:hypothetical protein
MDTAIEREKINDRKISYSIEEKDYILSKSHRRCCKCGRMLSRDDKMFTVDHFIPISKGGTNDIENLVPLCWDCNQLKSDYVARPYDFYSHLSDDYFNEIKKLFDDYCEKHRWATRHNFMKSEITPIPYSVPLKGCIPDKNGYIKSIRHEAYLIKANNRDLDLICTFVQKYNRKFGWNAKWSEVENIVESLLNEGAIYILRRRDEVIGMVPISFDILDIGGVKAYTPVFKGFPFIYQKWYYDDLALTTLYTLLSDMAKFTDGILYAEISIPKQDKFMYNILKDLNGYQEPQETPDSYWFFLALLLKKRDDIRTKKSDARKISDALQKAFDLKPIVYEKHSHKENTIPFEKEVKEDKLIEA